MAVVSDVAVPQGRLLRILGTSFGIAVAVGAMIGAGIMRAPSSMAGHVPDAWLLMGLWLFAAAIVALGANMVAELATAVPRDGGAYVYVHRAFGDVAGLAVGWTMWMSGVSAVSALCVAFADFLGSAVHLSPGGRMAAAGAIEVALFAYNYAGIREGRLAAQVTSALKALVLLGFVAAVVLFAPHHAAVTLPHAAAAAPLGFAGIVAAYQLIDGAYAGWDQPAVFTGENANPGRSIPRAMFGGLALTATLYIAVMAVLLATLGARGLAATPLPFSLLAGGLIGPAAGVAVAGVAMLIVLSCAHANLIASPRVLYALSEDRLLPPVLGRVNRGGTPYVALAMTSAASLALTLTGSFDLAFGLIATLNAATGIFLIAAFFWLRRKEPDLPRPYRAFGYPWLQILPLLFVAATFTLYMRANPTGAIYAAMLWALCVPLAMVARRAKAAAVPAAPAAD